MVFSSDGPVNIARFKNKTIFNASPEDMERAKAESTETCDNCFFKDKYKCCPTPGNKNCKDWKYKEEELMFSDAHKIENLEDPQSQYEKKTNLNANWYTVKGKQFYTNDYVKWLEEKLVENREK